MWFRKAKKINQLLQENAQLREENFDMSRVLFESQQFERIASEKLKYWVEKHDNLLIEFKKITGNA